eukprot:CAMPEP_0176344980 /NCGR_PEP_ID=MMETSP0126-20121128/5112_1 /TAXON_ID=141414 ORGANISM="Strombidinopsis acuminatum, Strain SPMC142" /NCGR_SAMPLE_ID=MMETSP0126 /ASSEMBLY_ACC=CAM_ASM_000229 /LENGTH=107 /DNA_ID=CAMNT_0017691723 /DNA_START=25 /DNA_END=348 /DNA_ORIENTATION=+
MKLTIMYVVPLFVVLMALSGHAQSRHDDEHDESYQALLRWIARTKGFLQGIGEGFYDDSDYLFNEECLNNEAIEAFDNMLEGYKHGEGADRFGKVMTAATTFVVDIN